MKIKKLSLAVAAVVSSFGAATAQAGPEQDVRVFIKAGGPSSSIVVRNFDWLESGSGLAQGAAPFGSMPPSSFTFLYQAGLGLFTDENGIPVAEPPGLNESAGLSDFIANTYEFTIAARIQEATDPSSSATNFVFNAQGGTVSIFYDAVSEGGTPFNVEAGTGFDDGTEIARFSIVPGVGTSNFSVNPFAGTGIGGTTYFFALLGPDDFVDPAFIQGMTGGGLDLHLQSSQTFPPGTSDTTGFHFGFPVNTLDVYPGTAVTASDLVFKIDGSSEFGGLSVPEPGTILLFGGGLMALGFAGRRALKTAAAV